MIEYLRLAFGTVLVLLPGLALGRTMSEVVAWTMGALFLAWTAVFTVHSNIEAAAILLLVLFVLAFAARRRFAIERRRPGGAIAIGIVLGWFLWHTAGAVVGDGLFHEARVRKLVELGDLHLRTVDEFKDGKMVKGTTYSNGTELLAAIGALPKPPAPKPGAAPAGAKPEGAKPAAKPEGTKPAAPAPKK